MLHVLLPKSYSTTSLTAVLLPRSHFRCLSCVLFLLFMLQIITSLTSTAVNVELRAMFLSANRR